MPWGSKRLTCSTRRLAGDSTISLDKQASAQPRPKLEPAEADLASKQNGAEERRAGLELSEQYAEAKRLPVEYLRSLGMTEFMYEGRPALRVPYRGTAREEIAVRFRIALEGDRFRLEGQERRPSMA